MLRVCSLHHAVAQSFKGVAALLPPCHGSYNSPHLPCVSRATRVRALAGGRFKLQEYSVQPNPMRMQSAVTLLDILDCMSFVRSRLRGEPFLFFMGLVVWLSCKQQPAVNLQRAAAPHARHGSSSHARRRPVSHASPSQARSARPSTATCARWWRRGTGGSPLSWRWRPKYLCSRRWAGLTDRLNHREGFDREGFEHWEGCWWGAGINE